jgi:hypothetical protein
MIDPAGLALENFRRRRRVADARRWEPGDARRRLGTAGRWNEGRRRRSRAPGAACASRTSSSRRSPRSC